jgi:outer membrane translocation and assembly module TamA
MTVIFDFNKKETEEDTVARMLMDAEYKRLTAIHKPKGQKQKEEVFKMAQESLIRQMYDMENPAKELKEEPTETKNEDI